MAIIFPLLLFPIIPASDQTCCSLNERLRGLLNRQNSLANFRSDYREKSIYGSNKPLRRRKGFLGYSFRDRPSFMGGMQLPDRWAYCARFLGSQRVQIETLFFRSFTSVPYMGGVVVVTASLHTHCVSHKNVPLPLLDPFAVFISATPVILQSQSVLWPPLMFLTTSL